MTAKVSGMVMETEQEFDDNKKLTGTIKCLIYQRGEKTLLSVKRVPEALVQEGEVIEDLKVRVFPWATDRGAANVSCSYMPGD